MGLETLTSPTAFLRRMLGPLPGEEDLHAYEAWWEAEGKALSETVDRAGTPHLQMFDLQGRRVDRILYPAEYGTLLRRGYREGLVWRPFAEGSLIPFGLRAYLTAYYDPGLLCPYTVSLSTAVPLDKYGAPEVKERFLPPLLRREGDAWQGATWMTEVKGGSDLGASVETTARPEGDRWRLTGDKYFASNVGAELAVVAGRPQGAPPGVRGLALFLVPRWREDGTLNYTVRRLKDKVGTRSVPTGEVELRDSEAYLLGRPEQGIYLILEVLNLSRVANALGSVALMQRALADAVAFARERVAFGRPVLQHPLLAQQIRERLEALHSAFALAWEALRLLDRVWRETPPYSERYHLFRLVAHLAKYWTAELAVRTARWGMEVHGGMGVLAEYGVDRWFREAMVLAIWEGTAHRHMLDGLEVMARRGAHRLLLEHLAGSVDGTALEEMAGRLSAHLALPPEEQEARLEPLFQDLARFTAEALRARLSSAIPT